jgi:DNA-binding MarR family transcriptional regulator
VTLPYDPIEEAARQWTTHGLGAVEEMRTITSIMRAQQILSARVEAVLRPLGLTFPRYEMLMLLVFSRRGALPLSAAGKRLMVHPTSITNTVDKLERDGYVERVPHPDDRRMVLAAITPDGRDIAKRATAALEEIRFGVGAADLDGVTEALETLRHDAGDFDRPT